MVSLGYSGWRITHERVMAMGIPHQLDKESEEGNRWWLRSSDSLILPAPLFFELDAFLNRVILKKKIFLK